MNKANEIDTHKQDLFLSKKQPNKLETDTKYYQTNYWMFNNQVFQYSVHIFLKNGDPIQIDSITMMTEQINDNVVQMNYMCIIKSVKTNQESYFKITTIFSFKLSNSKRIKCNNHLI